MLGRVPDVFLRSGSGGSLSWSIVSVLIIKAVAGVLIAVFGVFANAETYYAAAFGPECSSAATCECSEESACKFSNALIARLAPGDTLRLAPGLYPPVMIEGLRGAPYAPIKLQGSLDRDGVPSVVFDGASEAQDTIELKESAFIELSQITVQGAARAGLRINNSHNITVRGSLFRGNRVWGIFTNHANDVTASGNRITGPGQQHGIYLSNSGDGGLIEENYITGFTGSGIQLNGDKRMGGAAGVIGDGVIEKVKLLNNYLSDNGMGGGAAINLDGARNTDVRGNIIVGNHSAGVAFFRGNGAVATRETKLLENLIVGTEFSRSLLIMGKGSEDQLVTDNVFIGLNVDAALFSITGDEPVSFLARVRGDYEVPATFIGNYYSPAGPVANFSEGNDLTSLEEWLELVGDGVARSLTTPTAPLSTLNAVDRKLQIGQIIERLGLLRANPYRSLLQPSTYVKDQQ